MTTGSRALRSTTANRLSAAMPRLTACQAFGVWPTKRPSAEVAIAEALNSVRSQFVLEILARCHERFSHVQSLGISAVKRIRRGGRQGVQNDFGGLGTASSSRSEELTS